MDLDGFVDEHVGVHRTSEAGGDGVPEHDLTLGRCHHDTDAERVDGLFEEDVVGRVDTIGRRRRHVTIETPSLDSGSDQRTDHQRDDHEQNGHVPA